MAPLGTIKKSVSESHFLSEFGQILGSDLPWDKGTFAFVCSSQAGCSLLALGVGIALCKQNFGWFSCTRPPQMVSLGL